ncbi:MAG: hypothetical protein Q8R92_01590 [Deltaproteobacteria bacterium]|nr:hypothetical protein [Deltaproteobacteria bacterium]
MPRMKDRDRNWPVSPEEPKEKETHVVEFRIQDSDFRTLEGLARARQTSIASLVSQALPLIIEKFRVLRALEIQPDERAGWRRKNA